MKTTETTTIPPPAPVLDSSTADQTWLLSRKILSESGNDAVLSLVGPGVETPRPENPSRETVILFVSEGSVTATVGLTNFILRKDEALHVPAGKTHHLRNHTHAPAKVLTLSVPAPKIAAPTYVVGFP